MIQITYRINELLETEQIIETFYNSGYLPISDMTNISRIEKMFKNANLVISAWHDDKLVGIARSLCDFAYACYLSDICVHKDYRGLGIGKELINITKKQAGEECKLILHSSAEAKVFYEKIGLKNIADAFIISRDY